MRPPASHVRHPAMLASHQTSIDKMAGTSERGLVESDDHRSSRAYPVAETPLAWQAQIHLRRTARFASNAKVLEAPAEVLEVPHGLLSRTRESDADHLAHSVGTSLDHLGQWLSWATEEAADVQVQRRRCREAEAHWADGSEYAYVLRPRQSGNVIGGF
jgi:hypothetical protein